MPLYIPLLCRYSDLTLFTSAIRVNPNNGKLYSNLGHQYEHMKNYSYAEYLFRKGSEIQPDDAGAFMNLGRALKAMDHLEEAEQVRNEYSRSPVCGLFSFYHAGGVHTCIHIHTYIHLYLNLL